MTPQTISEITAPELLDKVRQMQADGCRLAQICCTKLPEKLELCYSFDKAFDYTTLRISLADTVETIPSISGIYWSAFLYENEIHDLFGVKISGIAVDYKGAFYKTAVKTPFNPPPADGPVADPSGEVKS